MSTVVIQGVWSDDVDLDSFNARRVDGFHGEIGQTRVEESGGVVIGVTGLGLRDHASAAGLRQATSAIARRVAAAFPLQDSSDVELEVDLPSFAPAIYGERAHASIVEGLAYGGYRFRMTGEADFSSGSFRLAGMAAEPGAARGNVAGVAVNRARDLVNLPPSVLTPMGLAERARRLLEPLGVRVVIQTAHELTEGGYGGIIAVGKGSQHPPLMLELALGEGRPDYAFVGKGVTYDSGGLSLKSAEALMTMKSDMSGAAAVIAAFSLLPALAPGRSFVGVVPIVENMPGPAATRPGDVIRLRDGSTLEILNTDFEGRVILADALARASEWEPATIIDLASLTYAAQSALGDDYAALVATDDELAHRLLYAGERSGDLLWRMPLQPGLHAQIASDVADYKNFPGAPHARTSSAALLLSEFVGDVPWAHVDMTGPCFRAAPGVSGAAGGTGFGVRLIAELAQGE